MVVVQQGLVLVGAEGPACPFAARLAQIVPPRPIGQHPGRQERRPQRPVAPLSLPAHVVDHVAGDGGHQRCGQRNGALHGADEWEPLHDEEDHAKDEHGQSTHEMGSVEHDGRGQDDPNADSVQDCQPAPVEQAARSRHETEEGEDVGHGEAGEECQGRAHRQDRHQREVVAHRRLWQGRAPQDQDDVRRCSCLDRRQEPQGAQLVQRIHQQPVEYRPAHDPARLVGDRPGVGGVRLGDDVAIDVDGFAHPVSMGEVVIDVIRRAVIFLGVGEDRRLAICGEDGKQDHGPQQRGDVSCHYSLGAVDQGHGSTFRA